MFFVHTVKQIVSYNSNGYAAAWFTYRSQTEFRFVMLVPDRTIVGCIKRTFRLLENRVVMRSNE